MTSIKKHSTTVLTAAILAAALTTPRHRDSSASRIHPHKQL